MQNFPFNDPVEEAIINAIEDLKKTNIRYKSYIEKSAIWASLKSIEEWKSFHFYHYFCNLYESKYNKKYKLNGNIARAYKRIEKFMKDMAITNQQYRDFIDSSFNRFFNDDTIPDVGILCSPSFFNKVFYGKSSYSPDTDIGCKTSKVYADMEDFNTHVTEEDDLKAIEQDLLKKAAKNEEELLLSFLNGQM